MPHKGTGGAYKMDLHDPELTHCLKHHYLRTMDETGAPLRTGRFSGLYLRICVSISITDSSSLSAIPQAFFFVKTGSRLRMAFENSYKWLVNHRIELSASRSKVQVVRSIPFEKRDGQVKVGVDWLSEGYSYLSWSSGINGEHGQTGKKFVH